MASIRVGSVPSATTGDKREQHPSWKGCPRLIVYEELHMYTDSDMEYCRSRLNQGGVGGGGVIPGDTYY